MRKILSILAVAIGLILLLLATIPYFFKDRIVELVKKSANEGINATINFDPSVGLSLFRNFPHFTLSVNDITIVGKQEFEGDTLLSLKRFEATLDIISVLSGKQVEIIKIMLGKPQIQALVSKNGKVNWDIAIPDSTQSSDTDTSDASSTPFSIKLKRFEIESANLLYYDSSSEMNMKITDFNHILIGEFTNNMYLIDMENSVKELTYTLNHISYLNKVNTQFNTKIKADLSQMKFTFEENELSLNAFKIKINGWVQSTQTDDIMMDVSFESPSTDFKQLISLIPAIYTNQFSDVKTSGTLAFKGNANGTYSNTSYPKFNFSLKVNEGKFSYPTMPISVSDVFIDFKAYNNTANLDGLKINLSTCKAKIGNDNFSASLFAENLLKDPMIDAHVLGNIDFKNIKNLLPTDDSYDLKGMLVADLKAKGNVSTIERGEYDNFNATGKFMLSDFVYKSKDLSNPLIIRTLVANLTPRYLNIPECRIAIGNSDASLNGNISNFMSYVFTDGILKANLELKSNQLNVNQFLESDKKPSQSQADNATDTASIEAPVIPSNLDIVFTSSVRNLLYDNMQISNFSGTVLVKNQSLIFDKIKLQTLGASVGLNGQYQTINANAPELKMKFNVDNLDIQSAFKTFNTIQKLAPIAEHVKGNMSTQFELYTTLNKQLEPEYPLLFATGQLYIASAEISNVRILDKAAQIIKYEPLKNPSLSNTKIQFTVSEGKIMTSPFDIKIASQNLSMSGYTTLDQQIAYTGTTVLPLKNLGSAPAGLLSELNKATGANIKTPETIPVRILFGGTFTQPTVSTDLNNTAKSEADNVKKQLADEAARRKAEIEAKAKQELEKQRQEAEARVKAETQKQKADAEARAKAELEKQKQEAERKAKEEEQKLRKKAEEEAKKKLKGLF